MVTSTNHFGDVAEMVHFASTGKMVERGLYMTPLKAIRAKCLECSGGKAGEVRRCTVEKCPLHPFRLGKRPDSSKTPGKPAVF